MIETLPWVAISVLLVAMLALWGHCSATRKELEDFKVKVAEQYTTNNALEKSFRTLVDAINELKVELKETRKEFHDGRRFRSSN